TAVAHDPQVTLGMCGERPLDRSHHAPLEGVEWLAARSQMEHGILQQYAAWDLRMLDEQLFELLELPRATEPLDQILGVRDLRSGRLDERLDRLSRASQGGAVDRRGFGHLAQPRGKHRSLLAPGGVERGIRDLPADRERLPRRPAVCFAVADQVEA